jgi:TetR/AcrR family transcriptional regulator
MARPRSPAFDDQRDAILAAAALCFAAQGYTATSMNVVAQSCRVSKPLLYHYVRDKHELLLQICLQHVSRLEALVAEVQGLRLEPAAHLRLLIERFTAAYARAQNEHRVLTEDVRFLEQAPRQQVLDGQRRVVQAFAQAITALRPDLATAGLASPMAMLLLGMINWTFTWMRADGPLTHADLAPLVSELFLSGLPKVRPPPVFAGQGQPAIAAA